ELLQLVRERQAVAALRLDGGGAVEEHAVQPPLPELDQLLDRGAPRRLDGRQNPSAAGGDRLVGGPAEALDELLLARSGEREVGVGIDEAGEDGPPGRVDLEPVPIEADLPAVLALVADEDDETVTRRQTAPLDDAEIAEARPQL